MPLILGTNSIKDTGFDVANSLRFNGDNFLQRNNPSATSTNDKKGTFSFWFKRDKFPNESQVFVHQADSSVKRFGLQIANNDEFIFQMRNDSVSVDVDGTTTLDRLYRDVSAWTHICFNYDTSAGTNGCKLFVNGSEQALTFGGTLPQNFVMQPNVSSFANHTIGRDSTQASNFWTGYLAEFMFVDGQQLAPTEFGEYDSDSPTIWKPKDITGINVGNLGYYLDFEDASSLGNDVSSVGNFTATNCATTDQSTDTCTNNYCTMNPLDHSATHNSTFSEGNLKVVTSASLSPPHFATFGLTTGKWYWEVKATSFTEHSDGYITIGITGNQGNSNTSQLGNLSGDYAFVNNGQIQAGTGNDTGYGNSYTQGQIIGNYLDLDNNKLYFAINGTLQNSGTGHSILAPSSTTAGFYMPSFSDYSSSSSHLVTVEFNFGAGTTFAISSGNTDGEYGNFEYSTTITGDGASKTFKAINSKNLAEYG